MNLKYQEIAFDYSTVKFFFTIDSYFNLIEKLLNVLNYEGKLFIPIKKSFNYGPQYFKNRFEERFMTNDFDNKYEIIVEPYPFERNDYLIERNYNEDYIVIRKKYNLYIYIYIWKIMLKIITQWLNLHTSYLMDHYLYI